MINKIKLKFQGAPKLVAQNYYLKTHLSLSMAIVNIAADVKNCRSINKTKSLQLRPGSSFHSTSYSATYYTYYTDIFQFIQNSMRYFMNGAMGIALENHGNYLLCFVLNS